MKLIPSCARSSGLHEVVSTTTSRRALVSIGILGAMVARQFAAATVFTMTASYSKCRCWRDCWTAASSPFKYASVLNWTRQATFYRVLLRWQIHSLVQHLQASGSV